MANENERHADIIAENRRRADEIERDVAEKMKRGEMTSDQYTRELIADIRKEAARLEAAHKREVQDALDTGGYVEAARKAKQSGDCAKLREALQSCLDTICRIVWIDDPEYDEDGHYLGANYAAVSRDKARAALSAPPRNCDKYANHNDAMKAFDAFVRERGWLGNPYTEAFKWLFAPATEKEGGAK